MRQPDAPDVDCPSLHTALTPTIGLAAGTMMQMNYYPFTLILLLIAARHPLFDNFDSPVGLIVFLLFSCTALLGSTLFVRRSTDQARKNGLAWLGRRIALLKSEGTGTSAVLPPKHERASLEPNGKLAKSTRSAGQP